MSLYKRGETWWISITHDGRRIRRSAGTGDKAKARQIHDQLKADLWQQAESGATLNDAVKLWLKAAPRSGKERSALRQLLSLYPSRPLADITGSDIAQALAEKGPGTANRISTIIRAALNLAVAHGLLAKAPKIPRRKLAAPLLRWLTRQEWARLRPCLAEHLQPAADFALATGLRQSNVFGLRWKNVDLARRIVWIEAPDSKSRKAICVPLSNAAVAALHAVRGQHPQYVFTYCGEKIGSPKTGWNAAIRRSGIEPARWHDLRHTWASWHIQAGTPLAVLKELGGWHSMDMVMRYAHLSPEHLAQWAENAVTDFVTGQARM